ncbi:MAG: hypothetical protein COA96_10090 [SAR86 cluster bacterium]|uniref:DUF1318 domain-containing protein n=1 Tax=SAR86 cluster bacterium TaxID=2030880 RepID=A0A2A5AZF5_9GAMM|nr:MAG: hypothetical protein COA96_10090 [SAR86 cluster bacterium]
MKNLLSKSAALLFCLLLIPASFAATLQEAKAEGLLGEQRDGYVGLVVADAPADIVAIVRDVNSQRRQRYEQIAQQNGITLQQVQSLAYEQAVEATQSGNYIQNASGAWVRK